MHRHCVNHGRGIINTSIFGITAGIFVHYQFCQFRPKRFKNRTNGPTDTCVAYILN